MLINWFTVFAQIVNFLILIYLLKRFLFGPILRAMAEREKKMADALDRAETAEREAREKFRGLEEEKAAFDREREALMIRARKEVEEWREEAVQKGRNEIERLHRAWVADMSRNQQAFLDGLKQRMVAQLMHMGEKVLRDLADQGLNRQVLQVFLEKVSDKTDMLRTHAAKGEILVQSGIPFEEDDEETLRAGLSRQFGGKTNIRVESVPKLGFGIQLLAGDRKTAWHLADYLQDLETEIFQNIFMDAESKA
ncbi:putative alternate F1F0 ATPase, F0 subunit B [delta proteobacterium NaphS2]|nr:putative alternate F1F0 ATPase, F0 subunit B [delta proteobacterium NaphS2]